MRLRTLLEGILTKPGGAPSGDPEVGGLCHDSRRVRPGDLFVALRGQRQDGHEHVAAAVQAGAVAVLAERPVETTVPVALVPSTLAALSPVAASFFGRPSRHMAVVGVTGTNGKTTFTYLLESILRAAGRNVGVIGTVDYRWAGQREPASNTTPFAADLHRLLARMRTDGVTHAVMEVSSHALALHRVEDIDFTGAVFTNLTRDHLDYHQDMESYFRAKARLFELLARSGAAGPLWSAINADDLYGERFLRDPKGEVLSYGLKAAGDVTAAELSMDGAGTAFTLVTPRGRRPVRLPLAGRYNVYNALAAAAAALGLGLSIDDAARGLESMRGVPGRLERVGAAGAGAPAVFVDYAHTDDALRNVLGALRPLTRGRLIVVFGCGGDRDRTKRPLMGEAAAALADFVIVTSDNPRSEEPEKIALDVEVGLHRSGKAPYEVHLDRAEAIRRAVELAGPEDVVLLAGKGHETYQIFKDRTEPFDDRETARRVLAERFGGGA